MEADFCVRNRREGLIRMKKVEESRLDSKIRIICEFPSALLLDYRDKGYKLTV